MANYRMKDNLQEQAEIDRQHLRNAKLLRDVMESEGWKRIIAPLLDKMIMDVVGYKKPTGEWDGGMYGDKRIGETKADRLLWYRQFGIDFNNHLFSFFNVARISEQRLKEIDKKKKNTPPMTNTVYNPETEERTTSFGDGSHGYVS